MTVAGAAQRPPYSRAQRRLRVVSFNIQAGASTEHYRQYVTRGWQHVLPHPAKRRNLAKVADALTDFDLVGLQEADGGSLRSGFQNQVEVLAEAAGFPFWTFQANRKVGRIATSSNGLLSRYAPSAVLDHRLPSTIKGRGVLEVRFGHSERGLRIYVAHLSLTANARRRQADYLSSIIGHHPYVVMMGDLNCEDDGAELRELYARTDLVPADRRVQTFPSWNPRRAIDHILISKSLTVVERSALPLAVSDHLPLAVEVELPVGCEL